MSAEASSRASETAHKTLTNSVSSFKRQVRPFITLDYIKLIYKPAFAKKIGIEIDVHNTGTTPALEVSAAGQVWTEGSNTCTKPPGIAAEKNSIDIGAGRERTVNIFSDDGISQAVADDINARKIFVCVQVDITYVNVFGEHPSRRFSAVYLPPKPGEETANSLFMYSTSKPIRRHQNQEQ